MKYRYKKEATKVWQRNREKDICLEYLKLKKENLAGFSSSFSYKYNFKWKTIFLLNPFLKRLLKVFILYKMILLKFWLVIVGTQFWPNKLQNFPNK